MTPPYPTQRVYTYDCVCVCVGSLCKVCYELPSRLRDQIPLDGMAKNQKRWEICLQVLEKTGDRAKFIEEIKKEFVCPVCLVKDCAFYCCWVNHT